MPILAAEPSVYPADLFELSPDEPRRWWVLHTRPRQEKALARQLHAQEVGFYLPLIAKRTKIRGKLVSAHIPLFPGYVFLIGRHEQLLQAYATRRAARHLDVLDQDKLWRDLRQVQRLIATGLPIRPELALVPGAHVAITTGPLAGLRGVIARTVSGHRFVVQVDFIQRGASVMMEEHALECVRD
jgi:transcription antitermination factor NusG